MVEATFALAHPLDLRSTLAPLRHGPCDPTMVFDGGTIWRATRTPQGPASLRISAADGALEVAAWGPGGDWALAAAPRLVGEEDDAGGFRPDHPVLAALAHRLNGLRIPRSAAVVELLVPTILAQKVTAIEANRSFAALVRRLGERAPGPPGLRGLRLPPSPPRLTATPSYAFHSLGVERRRAETIKRVAGAADRLERLTTMAPADARRLLCSIGGVGAWTAAKVTLAAMGDPDAVCTGDFHLPNQVAWALAGEARADDRRMLQLLESSRGHRGRVQRLIVAGGVRAPSFGPRQRLRSIAAI